MSIHLMKGEKIIWQSNPGKRYRTFIFWRDLSFTFIFGLLFNEFSKEVPSMLELLGKKNIFLGSVFIIGFGLLFTIFHQISFLFIKFYITTDRTIIKKGFISRHIRSIKHEHVHDTEKKQSIFDRILGSGTIRLYTANDSNSIPDDKNPFTKVPCLENIDSPMVIHQILEQAIESNANNQTNIQ